MRACFSMTVVMIATATAAIAQPVRHDLPKPPRDRQAPAPVVLASADGIETAAAGKPQSPPASSKPVIPRVTTCRCGDPQPGADPDPDPDQ